jgi:hypothetical protein
MLERFGDLGRRDSDYYTALACSLTPDSVPEAERRRVVRLAVMGLAGDGDRRVTDLMLKAYPDYAPHPVNTEADPLFRWRVVAYGLAAMRAGLFDTADRMLKNNSVGFQSGKGGEVRAAVPALVIASRGTRQGVSPYWLAQVKKIATAPPPADESWWERVIFDQLMAEARITPDAR